MSNLAKRVTENASVAASGAANSIDSAPAGSRGGLGNAITRAEHERRLYFVAEKMLDGMSRRTLVEMAMQCFQVSRRAAQRYVAIAERRLREHEAGVSPALYFALSKLQRDKLLESLFRQTNRLEGLEPQALCGLVLAANKVLDSRDRAAAQHFAARDNENDAHARVNVQVKVTEQQTELLRAPAPLQVAHQQPKSLPPTDEPRSSEADRAAEDEEIASLPPEVIGRMCILLNQGYTPQQAVDKVFAETYGHESDSNSQSGKELQPADYQV